MKFGNRFKLYTMYNCTYRLPRSLHNTNKFWEKGFEKKTVRGLPEFLQKKI